TRCRCPGTPDRAPVTPRRSRMRCEGSFASRSSSRTSGYRRSRPSAPCARPGSRAARVAAWWTARPPRSSSRRGSTRTAAILPDLMEQPPPRSVDRRDDPDRPHRASLVVLLVAFLILVAGVAAVGAYYGHCTSAGSDHRPVAFTVADGESGSEVVDRLAADGVIRCGGVVGRLMLQKNGLSDAIRAGTHQLTTGMTLDQAMAVLTTAPAGVPTVSITIPEGFRITQIASVVQRLLKIPASQFIAKANSGTYSLPPYLP